MSLHLTAFVALAVLLASVAAFPEVKIENEDMGMLTRNGVDPPGDLWCYAGEVEYRVPDEDVFALAFTSPAAAAGAWLEKVQLGAVAAAPCLGHRYPAFGPESFPKSTNVAVNYNQCGYLSVYDPVSQTITHSNVATVVVRLPSPSPFIIKRKTYLVPLYCVGSAVGAVITNTQYFPHVIATGPIFEQFGVSVSVKVRKDNRTEFLGERDASVNVITVTLDEPHPASYELIGHRCWATPTVNSVPPTAEQQLEFVSPRGCNTIHDPVMSVLAELGPAGFTYELSDFALDESGVVHFHCQIHVCYKGIDNGGHCTQSPSCGVSSPVDAEPSVGRTGTMLTTSPAISTDKRVV